MRIGICARGHSEFRSRRTKFKLPAILSSVGDSILRRVKCQLVKIFESKSRTIEIFRVVHKLMDKEL